MQSNVGFKTNCLGGSPLTELCHDNLLYAFPFGSGAKTFLPTGTSGAAIWPDATSAGSLAETRYNPAVVLVGKPFFLTSCIGC
jgi:hypothetical protein